MAEDLPDAGDRPVIAEEVLRQVPGGAPTAIRPLQGGSLNRSFHLSTSAGEFVVRLSPAPDAWLAADRSVEHELHRLAAEADLAPRIVAADPRGHWLITEFLAGRPWAAADFSSPDSLVRLAELLRRLHAVPAPACGRFDLLLALEGYVRRLAPHGEIPRLAGVPTVEAGGQLLAAAERAWQRCGAGTRPSAILHHDLHASNLIESSRGLRLIDWECAAVSDPLLDVACILSYYPQVRAHTTLLLQHSGLGGVTSAQLAAAVWLFDLHTLLWYRERRRRLVPTEAERQAEQRLAAQVAQGVPRSLDVP
ncbi:MAG TPA: choline/ethanolamine kinase family protein [Steroidobacteraceae bacterium]|nr:choline/ethanolamine kinase family protein [Steroidobacteraceae bacterium]